MPLTQDDIIQAGTQSSGLADGYLADLARKRAELANDPNLSPAPNLVTGQTDYVQNPQPEKTPANFDIAAAAQSAAAPQQRKIREAAQRERDALNEQEKEAKATQGVAAFRMGQTGTRYAEAALAKVDLDFLRKEEELDRQESELLGKAWDAALAGQVGASRRMVQEAEAVKAQKADEVVKQLQAQKQIGDIKKMQVEDFGSFSEGLIASGKSITDFQPEVLQSMFPDVPRVQQLAIYGLSKHEAGIKQRENEIKENMDLRAGAKFGMDVAKFDQEMLDARNKSVTDLVSLLGKTEEGGSVNIGGFTYTVTGKAPEVTTGTEIDQSGQAIEWQVDKRTGVSRVTPLGIFPQSKDWEKVDLGDKGIWRVNPKTGQALPFYASDGQKTYNAVIPDGVTGPTLPGSEQNAGQCGAFNNYCYGTRIMPDSFAGKKQAILQYAVDTNDVQVGDTFLMKSGSTGHVGIVNGVEEGPNGPVIKVTESNYVPPGRGKVSNTRTMRLDDPKLALFARIPTPNLPSVGSDSVVSMAASGNRQALAVLGAGAKPVVDKGSEVITANDLKSFRDLYPNAGVLPTDTLTGARAKAAKSPEGPMSKDTEKQPLSSSDLKFYIEKYPTAGITPNDTLAQARAKTANVKPETSNINAPKPLSDTDLANLIQNNPTAGIKFTDTREQVQAKIDALNKPLVLGEGRKAGEEWTGRSSAQLVDDIMAGTSNTKDIEAMPKKLQEETNAELSRRRKEAKGSGDTIGIVRASAGNTKDLDATALMNYSKKVNILTQLTDIQESFKKLKGGTDPIIGILRKNNPYDSIAREFNAKLTAVVPNLARGVYGEVGVLTNQDIETYKKTIPSITDTAKTNKLLMAMTVRLVQRTIEQELRTQAFAQRDVSQFADDIIKTRKQANVLLQGVDPKRFRSVGDALYEKQGDKWVKQK